MKTILLALILAILAWGTGCAGTSPLHPSEGWKHTRSQDPNKFNKAVVEDYQNYIKKLPTKARNGVGDVQLFEDGLGRHAVAIEVGLNGTYRTHVLIYDRENRRTKVVKYVSGHWRS